MIAPGKCKSCGREVIDRFPIIKDGADCRPSYCRECATSYNTMSKAEAVK